MTLDKETIQNLRQDYRAASLSESEIHKNPIDQFAKWFSEAMDCQIKEPNAMTLSTATANGKPSARIMLLKSFDNNGFIFYTNFNSRKGHELDENPFAALTFFWLDLERQIRIEGALTKLPYEEAQKYFHVRPRKSQVGAYASAQSSEIPSRKYLETKRLELEEQFKDTEVIPMPEHWGGYVVKPTFIEFWQGGSGRLHDRIAYTLENNNWKIARLAP